MIRPLVLLLLAAPLVAQMPSAAFAARRDALARTVGDGVIVVLGSPEPTPDFLPYQQSRPFFYLTGVLEADAALVMIQQGESRRAVLFVQPKDPAQEVWTGTRLGVDGVGALGFDGREASVLRTVLDSLLDAGTALFVAGDFTGGRGPRTPHDQFVEALRAAHPTARIADATGAIAALRGTKSPAELERLRIAAEISNRGHLAAIRLTQPGVAEFELQAIAEYVWRREGADGPGYSSIVGSGPNSTVLHYGASTRVAEAGEVIVMDMAASFDGYSADITRTIPVSGRFTDAQRELYSVVLAAQKAAERQVRVGAPARAMIDSANAALHAGLTQLGLVEAPGATYDCGTAERPRQCSQLSLYSMHELGHGIGLDVHDPEQYYRTGTIGVGSAFTIEPGVYVRENTLALIPDTPRNRVLKARIGPAVARHAGTGVRIEDDYLVTAAGVERPSALVPREIDEIERLMREPRTERDPAVVERYLRLKTGR
ncbi:MAG: aminopeptidase P family protein [Gemmatimonadaceae bacterium]